MAGTAGSIEASPLVAHALLALTCDCGRPAAEIHIVDPSTAHRAPRLVEEGIRRGAYPHGDASVARPACDRRTYDGYAFEVVWALREWHGWLDHVSSKGMGAYVALQRLVGRA